MEPLQRPQSPGLKTLLSLRVQQIGGAFAVVLIVLSGCNKSAPAVAPPPIDVTVMTVAKRETPVDFEFTAQTESSREVQIRARVDGFLEKRVYTEGSLVHAGQVLFLMDRKPFDAALQTAKGELAQQQARLTVAKANLARVVPLAAQNALSKKDLDDAVGAEKQAEASVISAQGQVQSAELNLSYTIIKSPLTGLSSFAREQEGSYVSPATSGLLTYVYQLDPMWVNFSVSENEVLRYRDEAAKGNCVFPPDNQFEVTVILADGSVYPARGRIDFANPAFSSEDGHVSRAGGLRQRQGHAAARTVRARARVGRGASGRHPRAATGGPPRFEKSFCLGRRRGLQATATCRRGRRVARQ